MTKDKIFINTLLLELDNARACIDLALKRMDDEDEATQDFLDTIKRLNLILDKEKRNYMQKEKCLNCKTTQVPILVYGCCYGCNAIYSDIELKQKLAKKKEK